MENQGNKLREDDEIAADFESLGDNCEFGLVQRSMGIEPLGLFRFNFVPLPALLRGLYSDFAGIDRPDQIEIYSERNNELMVRIRDYGFQYHTHQFYGVVDPETLRAQQIEIIRFLVGKFLSDLRDAQKIFVRKGPGTRDLDEIRGLLAALRHHGPVSMLCVVAQDHTHRCGLVEVLEPGLFRGYIDRLAPYDDAYDTSSAWLDILRGAHNLWSNKASVGSQSFSPAQRKSANLIRRAATFGGDAWWVAAYSKATPSAEVPSLMNGHGVIEVVLNDASSTETGAIYGYVTQHGLSSGTIFVASLYVWLPIDFKGTLVGAVFNGFKSVHISNARVTQVGSWQRIWVSARIPSDITEANPSLYVIGPAGTRLLTTCWKLEMGTQPTPFDLTA